MENFCSSKDIVKEIESKDIDQWKYVETLYLVSNLYLEHSKLNNEKTNNTTLKTGKRSEQHFTKENI